ncbi:riboflavin synthase, partial [bacterium]|nr:riboflavin synthase [bacterium]
MAYLMWKGWIAIDGVSLTISRLDREENEIAVSLIPETLERTTLGAFEVGSVANLELDAQTQTIVTTVREVLRDPGLRDLLQHG